MPAGYTCDANRPDPVLDSLRRKLADLLLPARYDAGKATAQHVAIARYLEERNGRARRHLAAVTISHLDNWRAMERPA